MRSFSSLSLLLSLSTLLLLAPFIAAQYERYTSGPIIAHTFDTRPDFTVGGRTNFEWSLGRPPHSGLARFVNNSRIDLLSYQDDNGKIMPPYLAPTLTLEFWAMYQTLGFWSRLIDCGNVAANGVAQDNVFMSNMANDGGAPSNDLHAAFHIGNRSESTTATQSIHPNSYQHFVATLTRDMRNSTRAHIELYVDGILRARQDNAAVLNSNVERKDCWLGRSNWEWDADFRGTIDDFFYYDYPLSSEAVLAHFVLNRPPVYEQTFSTDPRLVLGYGAPGANGRQASFFTYNWTNVDERDSSNITKYHDGHLVLAGDSYVDLAASNDGSDPSSLGAAPIPVIGGVSGGDGTLPGGWSFEILFKADTTEQWAKVFDCGNGKRRNNIILGYVGETSQLRLEQYVGANQEQWTLHPLDNVETNVWYHIVVVFQRERWDRIDPRGNVTVYVNGVATANDTNAPMPLPVQRTTCYIGKSHWEADQYFDLWLDAFRLYDYALSASDVAMLYLITHSPLPTDVSTETDHSWHSGPVASYTFNRAPSAIEQELGTHYNYTRGTYSATTFPHIGVATFNGVSDFVNLAEYDTDQGGILPVVGGSMSIETWVRWVGNTQNWQRVIDLGGFGGVLASNIILSAGWNIDELVFEVYSGLASGGGLHMLNGINMGEWMHIVAVAQQLSMNDTYSATSAVQRIYINGQYAYNGIGYLPPKVQRPSSWIARSNWYPNDWLFQGQIDSVHIYDRALDYEEVRAHYISYVPPVFELAFSRDPVPWLGLNPNDPFNQPTYTWEAYDPADQVGSATNYHNGHLVLEGDSWVNLSTSTGPSSIGTTVPLLLFRDQDSIGTMNGYPRAALLGWSFELTVKILTREEGAKIFDFGNGPDSDNVGIQWHWDGTVRSLSMFVYRGSTPANFIISGDIELGKWYHIIVTMHPTNNQGAGSYAVYIDGEVQPGDTTFVYPRPVPRYNCLLGASSWQDHFFDMKLDTFRIYNYVIQPEQAAQLYAVTTDQLTGVVRPLYDTAPFGQYSFNWQPDDSALSYDSNFEWLQGGGQHLGLARFNGVDQYINLLTYPDDRGQVLPTLFGNTSLTMEMWVRYDSFRVWSRLFDFGNNIAQNNILLGNYADTDRLAFHVYAAGDTDFSSQLNTAQSVWRAGQWTHVVVTVEDMSAQRRVSRTSSTAAEYRVYINGSLIANQSGLLPQRGQRQFSYIANSNWYSNGDELFNGTIDSLYVYNYALSDEQINVRYRLPKFPIFDLSFSNDPRTMVPSMGAPFTYTWQSYDPNDNYANNALYHGGHLVLNGTANSYVNLSAPTGPTSVGVVLPRFGGESQGIGLYTNPTQLGWSFEFIVKIQNRQGWAKLIDWGNGAESDNIILGYNGDNSRLDFEVWNPQTGTNSTRFTVIPSVVFGFWYHIVVVLVPIDVNGGTATYQSFVDGRLQSTTTGNLPRSVKRNRAFLGRSNWAPDGAFAASIDAIRVYDYALSADNVAALYSLANDPNGTPRPEPGRSSSSSTGRSSSSSSSSRRVSSSTSSRGKPCPYWAIGSYEPRCYCPDNSEGSYPNCLCPVPYDGNGMNYIPWDCEWLYNGEGASSSTGVAPGESGMSTATIAAIIFAVVLVAAIAAFVYYKYFRQPATTQDILGLGATGGSGGSTGGAKQGLLASTDVSQSHLAHHATNGSNGTNGSTNGASQPTGLDYYLAPDTQTQPPRQDGQGSTGGVELPAV